eukprot:SAG22_NODE_808_length_7080_cov_4.802034_3_plen_61_part_00
MRVSKEARRRRSVLRNPDLVMDPWGLFRIRNKCERISYVIVLMCLCEVRALEFFRHAFGA